MSLRNRIIKSTVQHVRAALASKPLVFSVVGVGSIIALFMLSSALDSGLYEKKIIGLDKSRDFTRIPFDELDAIQVCTAQTRRYEGDRLVHSYVDSHSTRWDEREGIYKVFLHARVGTHGHSEPAYVYCFINPQRQVMTFYDVVYPEKKSLMSRAMAFFKEITQ